MDLSLRFFFFKCDLCFITFHVFVHLFVVHFSFSRWKTLTSLEAFSHLVPSTHPQGCHLFLQKCSSIRWKVEVWILGTLGNPCGQFPVVLISEKSFPLRQPQGPDPNSWLRFLSIIFSCSTM